jgi:hypothetical protein
MGTLFTLSDGITRVFMNDGRILDPTVSAPGGILWTDLADTFRIPPKLEVLNTRSRGDLLVFNWVPAPGQGTEFIVMEPRTGAVLTRLLITDTGATLIRLIESSSGELYFKLIGTDRVTRHHVVFGTPN